MESWKRISFQNISCYCLTIPCIALFTLISIFQNISCYCLTGRKGDKNGRNIISKHLMLLFNALIPRESRILSIISKHLMLLFNYAECPAKDSGEPISKHLMFINANIRMYRNDHLKMYKITL